VLIQPQYLWLSPSGDPDETRLQIELPTGSHTAALYAWTLEQDDGNGEYRPVNAELISSYAVAFEVLNGSTTTISFQFETNGQVITVGAGALAVSAEVTELPTACTPFGDDCGEGAWCPPSGLTGAYLACRAAGPLDLGESCSSPADCPSNSTFSELDGAPSCVALCESSDVSSPCESGGVCQAKASDYGLCIPSSSSSD
jgi:hypothetical protein